MRWQEQGSSSSAEFLGLGRSIDASYRGCATGFLGPEECCLKTAYRKAGYDEAKDMHAVIGVVISLRRDLDSPAQDATLS